MTGARGIFRNCSCCRTQTLTQEAKEKKKKSLRLTTPRKTPTHTQPNSTAATIIADLSGGDIYTALVLTAKALLLSHQVSPSALSEAYISISLTPSPYAAAQVKGNEHFPRGGRQQRQPSALKKPPVLTVRSKRSPDGGGRAGRWEDAHPNDQATNTKSAY